MLHLLLACSPPSPTSADSGDLTPTALWVETELAAGRVPQLNQLPAGPPPPFTAPDTIRVWRRSQGGSGSCDGVVDVIDFDTYVKQVILIVVAAVFVDHITRWHNILGIVVFFLASFAYSYYTFTNKALSRSPSTVTKPADESTGLVKEKSNA